jgi:hypothetical protein
MHLFGLAIDIGYTRNPWLSNPKRNTARLAEITLRAARLLGPAGAGDHDQGITARFLHGLAITHGDTGKIHKILAEWSRWLAEYFALAGNAKRLEGLLPTANVMYPNGGWFKRGESLATAAARWARDIRTDFHDFAEAVARGGNKNEVRHGFMDLPRDLVIALRDDACLAWGTVDFGPSVSGDTMHFDCRVEGIGRAIAMTSGKAFVPDSGHRCIPAAGGGRAVERELEQEARRKSPPPPPQKTPSPATPGHWLFPFTSSAIPHYNDKTGNHSTACAIHVPDAAWHKNAIDLLVFFHGDKEGCASTFDPDPKVTSKKFSLDTQIHDSGRKLALAVPAMFWIRGNKDHDANIKGVWTAANFNKFVKEVLAEIGKQSGVTPTLDRLIIAGHSHAYAILTPLACEFDQDAPATKTEALAKLAEVWALDSTYGPWHARALEVWARKRPLLQFIAVLNKNGDPMKYWKNYSYVPANYCAPGFKPPNLTKCTVDDGRDTHCIIPAKYVRLLAAYSAAWCTF